MDHQKGGTAPPVGPAGMVKREVTAVQLYQASWFPEGMQKTKKKKKKKKARKERSSEAEGGITKYERCPCYREASVVSFHTLLPMPTM